MVSTHHFRAFPHWSLPVFGVEQARQGRASAASSCVWHRHAKASLVDFQLAGEAIRVGDPLWVDALAPSFRTSRGMTVGSTRAWYPGHHRRANDESDMSRVTVWPRTGGGFGSDTSHQWGPIAPQLAREERKRGAIPGALPRRRRSRPLLRLRATRSRPEVPAAARPLSGGDGRRACLSERSASSGVKAILIMTPTYPGLQSDRESVAPLPARSASGERAGREPAPSGRLARDGVARGSDRADAEPRALRRPGRP
jgi:hypothetical protein